MKIRINGNSIRLRLSKSDIDQVLNHQDIIASVGFEKEGKVNFYYALKLSNENTEINARFNDNQITVTIPSTIALAWANNNQVGLYHQQTITDGTLAIIIEKDFQCLHKRPGEDETDNFPNPNG